MTVASSSPDQVWYHIDACHTHKRLPTPANQSMDYPSPFGIKHWSIRLCSFWKLTSGDTRANFYSSNSLKLHVCSAVSTHGIRMPSSCAPQNDPPPSVRSCSRHIMVMTCCFMKCIQSKNPLSLFFARWTGLIGWTVVICWACTGTQKQI